MKTSIHPQPGHVLILGFGASGQAAARLALRDGEEVQVIDSGRPAADVVAEFSRAGARVLTGWDGDCWSGKPALAVISPGISPDSPLGDLAAGLSCPVISELEYGFRHCRAPVLAVTGTNGKTTTVECLTHCLKTAGKRAVAAGNIGLPLSDPDVCLGDWDAIVAEVSSFQLERIDTFAPVAAALLNVSPDHLDRHGDVDTYRRVKTRMLTRVADPEKRVARLDLAESAWFRDILGDDSGSVITFSSLPGDSAVFGVDAAGEFLVERANGRETEMMAVGDLPLQGRHNVENVLAGLAVAAAAGIPPMDMIPGLRTFASSPHRLQHVGVYGGVTFINDSKATNPDAMIRALEAVGEGRGKRILLIAGGLDKGVDFISVKHVIASFCKYVFLIGKCRERLANQWGDVVSCEVCDTMAAAVASAVKKSVPDDVVLLSPGCASMDMFLNYAERGLLFSDQVRRICEHDKKNC
ncbi:MAG: UDP-N-acetylmuramoyl-L-alanine--D-glutamate ligase [Lentisphaeria bacterium]|nr:UDP-N-acetylmuramoyl-L-alanine--D-glutamate ligase [Lentisphaeria bacterium]